MKKTKSMFLALVMATVFMFGGCGKTEAPENTEPQTANENQEKPKVETPTYNEQNVSSEPITIPTEKASYTMGNTPGNLQNGGRVAYYNGWVYYLYRSSEGSLWKIREDGTEKTLVSERDFDDLWPSINVTEEFIFYTGYKYEDDSHFSATSTLYRASLDGTNEIELLSFTDRSITNVCVVDDWIYYTSNASGDWNGIRDEFIHRMRFDGTEQTQLSRVRSMDMMIVDGWIYYHGYIDWVNDEYIGENYIYKMRLDGSDITRFNDNYENSGEISTAYNGISSFLVDGDWIYYVTEDYKIMYKIRTDFTGKEKVCEAENVILKTIQKAGDWLYYGDYFPVSADGKICRINNEGVRQEILPDVLNYYVYIVEDWLYYYDFGEEPALFRVRLDGTGKENIPNTPGLTVTEDELSAFFKEIFINGELRNKLRFVRGENTPIYDNSGELIIIGQDKSEHDFDWFYKIEPTYSIEGLKEVWADSFAGNYYKRMDVFDNRFRILNDELYFSMNDTIMQDGGEYNLDTFKITERNDLSVVCQIEVLIWTDTDTTEYVFTFENGKWKLSDEYLLT